jgi:hypothetical protein
MYDIIILLAVFIVSFVIGRQLGFLLQYILKIGKYKIEKGGNKDE